MEKIIPDYHTSKYHISPMSLYDSFLEHSAINNIAERELSAMPYGDYMDRGDALGYDDMEPYNYGYDEALGNIISSIGSFFSKAGSIASKTFSFSAKYAVKGFDYAKKISSTGWNIAKKLPSIGVKAVSWTYGKVVKPTAKWTAGAVKDVYSWKGWKPIGNRAYKIVGGTLSAGLQLIDTLGQAFIMTAGGEVVPAPTGMTQTPSAPYQEQPDSSQYPPSSGGGYPQYGEEEYLPVDLDSGWIYNPETGEPIREATEEEIIVAQKKKSSIWGYVIAGIGIASLIL